MTLQVYPYVILDNGEWSISDSVMAAIWLQLELEGKVDPLFYDGSVKDVSGWLEHLKAPGMFPLVVADLSQAKPVHVAWLKDVADGVAWAHHTALGRYKRGVWEVVVDYWRQSKLRLLLGMTPATNEIAVKFLKKICKFNIVGEIPGICYVASMGQRVPGVISYFQLAKGGESWVEKDQAAAA